MLTVYYSNQPEYFKNLLIDIMSNQILSNPMQSEVVIVNNKIMIEWIQLEIAKYFGIAANIIFMDLNSFITDISQKVSSNNFVINNFNCSVMYWAFMKILSQLHLTHNCLNIKKYLHNDINYRKRGQLSTKLVKLFTQYLIYRPDWLDSWKSGKIINNINGNTHQLWQSELWCLLLEYLKYKSLISYKHVNYLQHCVYLLKNIKKEKCNIFPQRVFIFGITSMPSIYWEILYLLSNKIDIHMWVINTYCKFNCDYTINLDLLNFTSLYVCPTPNIEVSKKYAPKILEKNVINSNFFYILNHIFLNVCGFIGINTFFFLNKLKNLLEKRSFFIPKEDSLLHILQKNILEFQSYIVTQKEQHNFNIFKNSPRYILDIADRSITFHICYNIQREIEILYDNLILMLKNDPFLLQKGIIVVAPDMSDYTAAIKTVFNNIHGQSLPFIIFSKHKKCIHPIISTFLNILNIPHSRCTSEEILSFLQLSLVSNKFNINASEVKLLRQWTIESGIKWGLDGITMYNLNLPMIDKNTWYFGLHRMLLGYAIHDQFSIWENVASYNGIREEHMHIIGKLGQFLEILRKWRDKLNVPLTLTDWMSCLQEILDDFFCCSNMSFEEHEALFSLKNAWKITLGSGIQSEYFETVNLVVLRDKLSHQLDQQNVTNYKFVSNVINFCDITPICCIPCQIVCFLGMNDNSFPRKKFFFDFDLMVKNPRINDDDIYQQDCYSFLLAFLLAKERIYISFINDITCHDFTSNASTLIHVLFEYIARHFYLLEDKNVDIAININRVRRHLCKLYNRVSFATKNFIFNDKIQNLTNEWISSENVTVNITDSKIDYNFITLLPKFFTANISFCDLFNFYRHPVKTWFQKRLGVHFDRNMFTSINDNNESFSLSMLHRFNVNTQLVNGLINNRNVNELYNSVYTAGMLPYGAFGELCWRKQCLNMITLSNQIKEFYISNRYNINILLEFNNNVVLTGQLNMVQTNGLVRWKASYLSFKDSLLLWLEHLVYCALGEKGDSRLFGINEMWHFPNFSKFQAKEFLFLLISGYFIGMNTPLLLLYKSGGAWLNQVFDWNERTVSVNLSLLKKARYTLIQAWQGIKYSAVEGECCDPYLRKLIPYDLSVSNIEDIIETMKNYFLIPMKYRLL